MIDMEKSSNVPGTSLEITVLWIFGILLASPSAADGPDREAQAFSINSVETSRFGIAIE